MATGRIGGFGWLLRTYLAPHWRAVAVLVAVSALSTALASLLPLLMAGLLDLALSTPQTSPPAGAIGLGGVSLKNLGVAFFQWFGLEPGDHRFRLIVWLAAGYVAVGFLKGWADFGAYLVAVWIRARATASLQLDLFGHLLRLSMSFFTRQRTGELVSRLDNDAHAATYGLETIVGTALTAPLLVLIYGYLLVRTSPTLVLGASAAVILHWAVTRAIRGPIRRLAADEFSAFADRAARLQEAILSIRVVKSFGAEAFELARVARTLADVVRVNVKFSLYKHAEEPARSVINYLIEASILVIAAWELLAGRLAVPTFFLFLYVGRVVVAQVARIYGVLTQVQATVAATGRLAELFRTRPDVQDGPEAAPAFADRIVLRSVSFDYGGERVLDQVSFEIGKGEVVALVGPSGVGKSTLADLVLRLYDPSEGTIEIDGRDLRRLRQASYRALFGVVPQEPLLFNGTIRENIVYGRDDLAESEVIRAARIANAHDFIGELPEGYDTVVGDRGIRLSGGQRQRVALARAIVRRPAILVLDEATSSLDSESERLVQQAIDRVIRGTTSIVIAHRLSTVRHADRIVVLHRGGVAAIGRHAELLASSEPYRRLYHLEFAEAGAGADPDPVGPELRR